MNPSSIRRYVPIAGRNVLLTSSLVLCVNAMALQKEPVKKSFDTGRAGFVVRCKDLENPYRVMAVTVMPREILEIKAISTSPSASFIVDAQGGQLLHSTANFWKWKSPEKPGLYSVKIAQAESGEAITLNVFVLTRYNQTASLNGYTIGKYYKASTRDDAVYKAPEGFIELNEENLNAWVSPHFQLKQFACKQGAVSCPKYLIVQPKLLLKLELLLERVNAKGIPAKSFYVMSAFRTPAYNKAIGNVTSKSRHHYGDAADIFVDEDGNGRMDDVNGDGKSDEDDAKLIRGLVEEMDEDPSCAHLVGGTSLYKATAARGPMVHVDTRGIAARW